MGALSLRTLSESEVEVLHQKSLSVLSETGVKIFHAETLRRLARSGAKVNEATSLVRFPPELVTELLSLASPVALETGLNGKLLEAGGSNRYFVSLILDPFVIPYGGEPRSPVLEDVRRHTIIGESLGRINSLMRMQQPVSDVPAPDCYLKTMEVFLTHTTKHIPVYPTSPANLREWFDAIDVMGEAAGIDTVMTPLLSVAMAVTSPLQVTGPNIDLMLMTMERSYPVIPTVCPMAGTTSPYSIAGTALLANVESLLPVLITQLYKPGHPVFYGVGPSITDMKSGHDLYYRAEKFFFKTLGCEMGRYYKLPISGEAGGSLTYRPDAQNGAESVLYLLSSFASGQNIIGGLGSLHNANGMSAEQIIMQCGLADMAEYLSRGIDLSEEKLGLASIRDTGPGGNFLTDELTLAGLRGNEFFDSPYLDLSGGYEGRAQGMYEIAHEEAERLVSAYKPTVPEKVSTALREYMKKRYRDPRVADL